MASRKLRFAIFGNTYQPKKSVSIQKLLACLSARQAEVFIEREFYTNACRWKVSRYSSSQTLMPTS